MKLKSFMEYVNNNQCRLVKRQVLSNAPVASPCPPKERVLKRHSEERS